jgi:hypothetical protein
VILMVRLFLAIICLCTSFYAVSNEDLYLKKIHNFNLSYAGPLLPGPANVVSPGVWKPEPYLFIINNYAKFNSSGKSISQPNLLQITPVVFLQTGIVDRVDLKAGVFGTYNRKSGVSSGGIGDTSVALGIGILKASPNLPTIKLNISEIFPTGKYQNLKESNLGLDGIGSGAYITGASLSIWKIFWNVGPRPFQLRSFISYKIPTSVHVKGRHAYGGESDTMGKVHPSKLFTTGLALDYCFIDKWIFATDLCYLYGTKATFSGAKGTKSDGSDGVNSHPFRDQLSLAPAIEFNPSEKMGFVAGTWFTVFGRNANNFVSVLFNYYQLF